jgi:hypothetical protein
MTCINGSKLDGTFHLRVKQCVFHQRDLLRPALPSSVWRAKPVFDRCLTARPSEPNNSLSVTRRETRLPCLPWTRSPFRLRLGRRASSPCPRLCPTLRVKKSWLPARGYRGQAPSRPERNLRPRAARSLSRPLRPGEPAKARAPSDRCRHGAEAERRHHQTHGGDLRGA